MKGKVCVFGSFNLDIVAGMSRFPRPGESLIADNSMMGPGGKGANQAMAALRAGARVHYIGKIGQDDFGNFARRHLENSGFDAITLFTCKEKPTGNALIYVAGDDAENMISVYPGANLTVTAAEVTRCQPTVAAADILLMQLENNLSAIQRMIDTAQAAETRVILNPAPWQKVSDTLLARVDLLTPNSHEATQLTGVAVSDFASAQRAAQVLHDKGVRQLIITLGMQGALLSDRGKSCIFRCSPLSHWIPPAPEMPLTERWPRAWPRGKHCPRLPILPLPMLLSAWSVAAPPIPCRCMPMP